MKTIYLIRHGQAQANVDQIFAGSLLDSPLTKKGLEQADLAATRLQGKTFDVIVSSPLQRAKVTAERIAQKVGYSKQIVLEPLLRERNYGTATGESWGSAANVAINNGTVEGLETIEQLAERCQQILDRLRAMSGQSILVVSHGTVEAMLQTIYQGRPSKTFLETTELDNTEVREYSL